MKTIDNFEVAGLRVLVRADLNVPLDGGRVADDGRIRASLPTLTALTTRGAKVIVCAHLGRPGGKPDPRYSLAPVAARLGELLGDRVELATDWPATRAAGTRAVAQAIIGSDAFTLVGGGDTGAAIRALGFAEDASGYVSTGGGASLECIQGKSLPGLAVLEDS